MVNFKRMIKKFVFEPFAKSRLRGAGSVSIGEVGAVSSVEGVDSGWHSMNASGSRRPHPSPLAAPLSALSPYT